MISSETFGIVVEGGVLLVEPKSAVELTDALNKLAENADLCAQVAQAPAILSAAIYFARNRQPIPRDRPEKGVEEHACCYHQSVVYH